MPGQLPVVGAGAGRLDAHAGQPLERGQHARSTASAASRPVSIAGVRHGAGPGRRRATRRAPRRAAARRRAPAARAAPHRLPRPGEPQHVAGRERGGQTRRGGAGGGSGAEPSLLTTSIRSRRAGTVVPRNSAAPSLRNRDRIVFREGREQRERLRVEGLGDRREQQVAGVRGVEGVDAVGAERAGAREGHGRVVDREARGGDERVVDPPHVEFDGARWPRRAPTLGCPRARRRCRPRPPDRAAATGGRCRSRRAPPSRGPAPRRAVRRPGAARRSRGTTPAAPGSSSRRCCWCGRLDQVTPPAVQPFAVRSTGRTPRRTSAASAGLPRFSASEVGPFQRAAVRGSTRRSWNWSPSAVVAGAATGGGGTRNRPTAWRQSAEAGSSTPAWSHGSPTAADRSLAVRHAAHWPDAAARGPHLPHHRCADPGRLGVPDLARPALRDDVRFPGRDGLAGRLPDHVVRHLGGPRLHRPRRDHGGRGADPVRGDALQPPQRAGGHAGALPRRGVAASSPSARRPG